MLGSQSEGGVMGFRVVSTQGNNHADDAHGLKGEQRLAPVPSWGKAGQTSISSSSSFNVSVSMISV